MQRIASTSIRRLLVTTVLTTVLVLALLAGAAVATPGCAHMPDRISHPTGADVVIFHTDSSPNGWGGEYRAATDVTVYGDGRVVFGNGDELRVNERGLQRLLRGARSAGLLDDTDFGEAGVTDQGTTVVEVTTDAGEHSIDIYALELPEGDRGLPKDQRAARRDLRQFLHSLGERSSWAAHLVTPT